MPAYISLVNYTAQGVGKVKESPDRLDAARRLFQDFGAEMRQFYLVMGQYDIVVIFDAPDDETVAKLMLALGSRGNVRTQTFRAFEEEEFRSIVASLP